MKRLLLLGLFALSAFAQVIQLPPGSLSPVSNTIRSAPGAPARNVGNNGDFYVDTTAHALYGPKAGGLWPNTGLSLVGPTGPIGNPSGWVNDTPAGLQNGVNPTFTLAQTPLPATSLILARNGVIQQLSTDYVLSGQTITFSSSNLPVASDSLQAWYPLPSNGAGLCTYATSSSVGCISVPSASGLLLGGNGSLNVAYGTTATTAAAGNDARIVGASNASNLTSGSVPIARNAFTAAATGAVTRTDDAKLKDGPLNVTDFGALGDGVTDDSAAFNTALAALTTGKSLYVPGSPSGYVIHSALAATGLTNVNIFGDGMTSKLIFTGNLDYGLTLTNPTNLILHDLQFSSVSIGQLLRLVGAANVHAQHLLISGGATRIPTDGNAAGIYVVQNSGDVWIEDSVFSNNGPPKLAATVTNVALASNVVTVTAVNTFATGQAVTFSGVTTAAYLLGQPFTVTSASGSQFTFALTHANDSSHADTGTAAIAADGADLTTTAFSYVTGIHVRRNRVYGSNTQISLSVINCLNCDVLDNDVDQNNAYSGTNADGYGICVHGESAFSETTATRTTPGVVTITTSAAHGYVPGEYINVKLVASSGATNFNGVFPLLSASGSTFTYQLLNTTGSSSDTGSGGIVSSTSVATTVGQNRVRNAAGTGIYLKNLHHSSITANTVSNFGQEQTDGTLAVAGIAISGSHNVVDASTVFNSIMDGIATTDSDNNTIQGGTITDVRNGVNLRGGNRHRVANLEISGVTNAGIYGAYAIDGIVLADNTIDAGTAAVGISFSALTNSIVRGNWVNGGTVSEHIVGSNNVIGENHFQNAPVGTTNSGPYFLTSSNFLSGFSGNASQDTTTNSLYTNNIMVGNGNFGLYNGNNTNPISTGNELGGNAQGTSGATAGSITAGDRYSDSAPAAFNSEQLLLAPSARIGAIAENTGLSALAVGYGYPKTDTTIRRASTLAQSNEDTNPFGLYVYATGGATPAARSASIQTGTDSVDDTGTLFLQESGGTVAVGYQNSYFPLFHVGGGSISSAITAPFRVSAGASKGIYMGYDTTNTRGVIGATTDSISNDPVAIAPYGGGATLGNHFGVTDSGTITDSALAASSGLNSLCANTSGNVTSQATNCGSVGIFSRIGTGSSSNTDVAGQLTLVAGTASFTFVNSYVSAPICTASDTTAANALRVQVTTSTLTLTGTATDVLNYTCVARN